jgi:hypothetical protein
VAVVAATIPRQDVVLYDTLRVGTSTHAKVLLAFKTRADAEDFQDVMTCCAASLLSKHVFLKRFGPAAVGALVIFDSESRAPPPPRPPAPPGDPFTASVAFAGIVVGVAALIVLALFFYLRVRHLPPRSLLFFSRTHAVSSNTNYTQLLFPIVRSNFPHRVSERVTKWSEPTAAVAVAHGWR